MASFPRVPSALADVGMIVPGGGPKWSRPIHPMAGERRTGKGWKVVKTPFTMRSRVGSQSQRDPNHPKPEGSKDTGLGTRAGAEMV